MTNQERYRMSEPMLPGPPRVELDRLASGHRFVVPMWWPRVQVSYFQALGVLRLLAEQVNPNVTCRYDHPAQAFVFSLPREDVDDFFRTKYVPSQFFSPWNARSFGPGFARSLKAAEGVPQLSEYVRVVRAAEAGGPPAKTAGRGEASPKEEMVLNFLAARTAGFQLSPSHTLWARACWRLDLPEKKVAKKTGKPKPRDAGINARPVLGMGGCEGSCDYGALFLRAAVAHFRKPGRVNRHDERVETTGEWTLGGFGFGENGMWWSPLHILLMLEGAAGFSFPWGHRPIGRTQPWHQNGWNRGELHLPIWEGELAWEGVRKLVAAGWVGPGAAPAGVSSVCKVTWAVDGQISRMVCGTGFQSVKHLVQVRLSLYTSPDEGPGWGWDVNSPAGGFSGDDRHESRDGARRKAMAEICHAWGDLAVVTEEPDRVLA
jgi:hypothetical protein